MATGPKFTAHQREAKIYECSELYLAGRQQIDIAAKLEVTQQQVSAYLKTIQQRWQAAYSEKIDARKAVELARLDRVERKAWAAWDRSCENAQTTVNRAKTVTLKIHDAAGLMELPALEREWTHTERGQIGDPRFLTLVTQCVELRLKVLGGFAPAKVEVTHSWREQAVAAGLNPDALVDNLFAKIPVTPREPVDGRADNPGA